MTEDVAPNGAGDLSGAAGYKDSAPTELRQTPEAGATNNWGRKDFARPKPQWRRGRVVPLRYTAANPEGIESISPVLPMKSATPGDGQPRFINPERVESNAPRVVMQPRWG